MSYAIGTYVEIFRDGKWNAAVVLDLEDSFDDGEILVKFIESGKTEWIRPNSPEVREIDNPTTVTASQPNLDENKFELKKIDEPQIQLLKVNESQLPELKLSEHSLVPPVIKEDPIVLKEKTESELPIKYKYQVGDSVIAAWSKNKNQPARIEAVLSNNEFRIQFDDGVKKVVSVDQLTKEADIMPDPSFPKYSTRHKNIDFNSLQNTEEIRHKKKKKKSKHKYKFNFKLNKPITLSEEASSKNEIVIQAEVHNAPEPIDNFEVESKSKDIFDPSKSFVLVRKTGERQQTIPVEDPRLPLGWYKHKTFNQNRWTAFIVNQEGKKFFGRKSLIQYFKNRNMEFPEDKFSFSYILDSQPRKRRFKFNTEKKIKTLSPLVQSDKNSSSFSDLNSSLDSEGNHTCPKEECGKKFRKENLLMMHLKHYHPEYKNMLPPTPNVADLAFARTNNMDTSEEHPRLSKKRDSGGNSENMQVPPLKLSLTPVKLSPPMPSAVKKITESPTSISDFNADVKKSVVPISFESKESDNAKSRDQSLEDFDIECQIAQFEIVKKTCEVRVKYGQNNAVAIPAVPEIKESVHLSTTPPSVKLEKMKKEEVVNCVCGVMEEDGLMIMCELCLCWQHAHCFNIESDGDVPERYICNICKHPPLQRKSLMYAYDEDWLKKGTLPTLDENRQFDEEFLKTQKILCKSHSLTGNLCKISNALHDASIKVQIVQEPNHPKLYLWDQCIKPEDQNDIKVKTEGPIIPKPEAPIDNQQCRLNLLTQVEQDYDLMEKHLDELESQLNDLETDSSSLMGDPANDKPTLQMLLRDLETLRNLAIVN